MKDNSFLISIVAAVAFALGITTVLAGALAIRLKASSRDRTNMNGHKATNAAPGTAHGERWTVTFER